MPSVSLRFATYNMHSGTDEAGQSALDRQAQDLEALDADIVCVQEVDHRNTRSGGTAQAHELARLAGYPHVSFAPAMTYRGGWYGNAVLSRLPILAATGIPFTPAQSAPCTHVDGKTRPWPAKLEPRSALLVEVQAPAGSGTETLHVVSAHLSIFSEERQRAVGELLEVLGAHAPGIVLIGIDANVADRQCPELQALLGTYSDLTAGTPAEGAVTFPASAPAHAIDLLLGRGVEVEEAAVFPTAGTDHHALACTLRFG